LFDAAVDLGLIRARVCTPSSLVIANRHAQLQAEALQAFKEQWCAEEEEAEPALTLRLNDRAYRLGAPRKRKAARR